MRLLLLLGLVMLQGCTVVERVGMKVLYTKASLPEAQVTRDIVYKQGSSSPKHRLDLFRPASGHWPVMVFVHGGGWVEGDKAYRFHGDDVYGNIGRFYASQGIGVAVINYRLQPEVTWRQQVADVADAVDWVNRNVRAYGGDSSRVFLAGHSAGAHLASFVAVNRDVSAEHGLSRVAGVICVSGAALDITDQETYRLGNRLSYYAGLFAPAGMNAGWEREASPATYVRKGAPPFLILYAEGDSASLRRQARHFHDILDGKGVPNRVVVVPGESHARIVLTLSRGDKTAGPAILGFMDRVHGG
ncbi:MAG: alpha/beta hydrolase [Chthoniobacteraceae bacterium]